MHNTIAVRRSRMHRRYGIQAQPCSYKHPDCKTPRPGRCPRPAACKACHAGQGGANGRGNRRRNPTRLVHQRLRGDLLVHRVNTPRPSNDRQAFRPSTKNQLFLMNQDLRRNALLRLIDWWPQQSRTAARFTLQSAIAELSKAVRHSNLTRSHSLRQLAAAPSP